MNTWTCNVDEPYFSLIVSGKKTHEGRVNIGKWSTMKVDDILVITSGDKHVASRITDIVVAVDFDSLHSILGESLLPGYEGKANEVYSKFPGFTTENVAKHGVVGVGLKLQKW